LQNSAFRNEFEGLDTSKSNGLQRNSLLSRTGNFCQGTGNLHAANREFQPPSHDHRRTRFLIGRNYQPCPPPTEACDRHRPEPHHRAGGRQSGLRPVLRRHLTLPSGRTRTVLPSSRRFRHRIVQILRSADWVKCSLMTQSATT
jgi:hypothetical protein